MMVKRIAILLLVTLFVLWFVGSFNETTLTERAIVLGLGIDKQEDLYKLSAEVIVPTNASGSTYTGGSRVVECYGSTVAVAIEDLFHRSGRVPSLGQCAVLVIGESVYKNENLTDVLSFFYLSEAFADNTLISLAKGEASEIFNKQTTLDSYVSIVIESISHLRNRQMGVVSNVMQRFMHSMFDKSGSSYLSIIEFNVDNDAAAKNDESSKKIGGYFETNKVALFRRGKYVTELSDASYKGLALVKDSQTYLSFVADNNTDDISINTDVFSKVATLGMTAKTVKVDYSFNNDTVIAKVDIKIKLKRIRTDSTGSIIQLTHKKSTDITEQMIQQVTQQISDCITSAYKQANQYGCDYLDISNKLNKKYHNKYTEFIATGNKVLDNIELDLNIEVDK